MQEQTPIEGQQVEVQDIKQFDMMIASIANYVTQYANITIKGTDDVEGIEKAKEAKKDLSKQRTSTCKVMKAARESAIAFQKAIISKEKEYLSYIEPIEEKINSELDRIKQLQIMKERSAILPMRVKEIKELGNETYDEDELLKMDDNEFMIHLNLLKAKKFEEQKAKIEEMERKEREAKEKEQRDQEIKEAQEKAAAQAKIDAEKKAKEDAERQEREYQENIKKQRFDMRGSVLQAIGFSKMATSFSTRRCTITNDEIRDLPDENFARVVEDAKEAIQKGKQKEAEDIEKERQEKEKKEAEDRAKKLAQDQRYQDFLQRNGYTEDTKSQFAITEKDGKRYLYKLLDTFTI